MLQDGKNMKSDETPPKGDWTPILMFLGVICFTLGIIVAGYFYSGMDVTKVYHSIISS